VSHNVRRYAVPSPHLLPRARHRLKGWAVGWDRVGNQTQFYAKTISSIGDALAHYKVEVLAQIAQMGLGAGALAVIGGTIGVVGFLTISTGALTAVQGYNSLAGIGVEALQGFTAAYIITRVIAPLVAAIALAATIGAGATAQLGAMRIAEEIDALEVMAIRSVAYLASTRVIAGVVAVIPLYCVGVLCAYLSGRFATTFIYGQSTGVYDHYFNTFLSPTDLIWSYFQVITMAIVVMLVHTYYGYHATGGPAGVGEATGRAVRTSLISVVVVVLFVSLAIYGQSGAFNLSG
jgi:phospholipid/cholesterol/gamma-HCH transport system permease protein